MNHTIQIASLLTALFATACLPSLELKQPQRFTDPMVKRLQFEDRCGLQRYFDRKPPRILILSERAVSPDSRTEVGQAEVLVRRGPQLTELGRILNRFYREVPGWLYGSDVTVATDFLRRIPRPVKGRGVFRQGRGVVVIPTTATITMASGKNKVEIAYHPCVGELLFGRQTYRLRRLVLSPAPPPRRIRPRPVPRAQPRARPNPRAQPRVRPRVQPRVQPRAQPRTRPRVQSPLPPLPR